MLHKKENTCTFVPVTAGMVAVIDMYIMSKPSNKIKDNCWAKCPPGASVLARPGAVTVTAEARLRAQSSSDRGEDTDSRHQCLHCSSSASHNRKILCTLRNNENIV